MKTEILPLNSSSAKKAAELIHSGNVVAFPTETVYGLGASVFDEEAVKKIFAAKGRPADNPLIVHVASKDKICTVASEIPKKAQIAIDTFMPGPITVVLPKRKEISPLVTGGKDTVGVRIPEHKLARMFLEECDCPIPAPSANSSTKPSPTTAKHVFDDLNGKIPLILDGGACLGGVESTVISFCTETPTLLRPGLITLEMLRDALGEVDVHPSVLENCKVDSVASPGMKYKHYSPKARVIIVSGSAETVCSLYDSALELSKRPVILWNEKDKDVLGSRAHYWLIEHNCISSAARNLFALLRQVDDEGFDTVFITAVDKKDEGLSVMNRMLRASAFTVLDDSSSLQDLKTALQING